MKQEEEQTKHKNVQEFVSKTQNPDSASSIKKNNHILGLLGGRLSWHRHSPALPTLVSGPHDVVALLWSHSALCGGLGLG